MTSLDGLRALEQAATPGPWSTRGVTIRQGLGVTEPSYGPIATTYDSEADAEFIAEARNALPGLLGRVEAAEAERDALAKQLDEALSANHDGGYAIIGLQAERDALLFRAERADAKIAEALGWLRDYCEAEGRPYLVSEAIGDLNWASDALAASVPPECEHEWVDARNEVVESGELCVKCRAVRAASVPSGPAAGPTTSKETR